MNDLLKEFVTLVLSETDGQLLGGRLDVEKEERGKEDDSIDEFSGTGAIAGMTLPLGMSPGTPTAKRRKRRK